MRPAVCVVVVCICTSSTIGKAKRRGNQHMAVAIPSKSLEDGEEPPTWPELQLWSKSRFQAVNTSESRGCNSSSWFRNLAKTPTRPLPSFLIQKRSPHEPLVSKNTPHSLPKERTKHFNIAPSFGLAFQRFCKMECNPKTASRVASSAQSKRAFHNFCDTSWLNASQDTLQSSIKSWVYDSMTAETSGGREERVEGNAVVMALQNTKNVKRDWMLNERKKYKNFWNQNGCCGEFIFNRFWRSEPNRPQPQLSCTHLNKTQTGLSQTKKHNLVFFFNCNLFLRIFF